MALKFPDNPELGEIFTGDNTVTYVYTGDRWSSQLAMHNGVYVYAYEGGNAFSIYNPILDTIIDGGDSSRNPILITFSIPKYHWRRDKPDPRDQIYQLAEITQLPAKVDLRNYDSPIGDQGQLGSCTGNAIAGAIELIDRKNNKAYEVSRLFIYYQERVIEGTVNYDSGAYIRDGLKAVNQYGAPMENLWPYNINKFTTRPSTAAYTDAAKRKVTGYQKCTNFNAVKNAIAAGNPVVVGFDVYSSFESASVAQTGMMPYPNVNTEQLLGGHAVCLVGYDDNLNGGRFIARNSWGTGWGDKGYFYMPYRVIQDTTMSSDFWLIQTVSNP